MSCYFHQILLWTHNETTQFFIPQTNLFILSLYNCPIPAWLGILFRSYSHLPLSLLLRQTEAVNLGPFVSTQCPLDFDLCNNNLVQKPLEPCWSLRVDQLKPSIIILVHALIYKWGKTISLPESYAIVSCNVVLKLHSLKDAFKIVIQTYILSI